MEDAGNSFFHMMCGAVLFVVAVLCLLFGIRGVTKSVAINRELLSDDVVYEAVNYLDEFIVDGEYVVAYLMSEPKHIVYIVGESSAVAVQRDGNLAQSLLSAGVFSGKAYRVSYEYGMYGDIRQVSFMEVSE